MSFSQNTGSPNLFWTVACPVPTPLVSWWLAVCLLLDTQISPLIAVNTGLVIEELEWSPAISSSLSCDGKLDQVFSRPQAAFWPSVSSTSPPEPCTPTSHPLLPSSSYWAHWAARTQNQCYSYWISGGSCNWILRRCLRRERDPI